MTPFAVATAMIGFSRPTFAMPSPAAYAKAAVATIGVQEDTYGCFAHAMQVGYRGDGKGPIEWVILAQYFFIKFTTCKCTPLHLKCSLLCNQNNRESSKKFGILIIQHSINFAIYNENIWANN
ncbi:MAG: hypothetical protein A6F71_10175 [Cycloclasticus sp. symbiont of Poecilosclerida sp. M]|nr:MAG: hypothetical protein A6F71_10175 [Cycloclasticus sp. symbiont of Poecilosclerida sp. M]